MDILIKNMEMPNKCYNKCPFCDDRGDYPRCIITGTQKGYTFIEKDIRMEDCPLVALPEHGRLIDADALCNKLKSPDFAYFSVARFESIIDEAETIVEATE